MKGIFSRVSVGTTGRAGEKARERVKRTLVRERRLVRG
jgi:hypothetical protein